MGNQFYKPKMDNSISNVGIKCTGEVNPHAFMMFLGKYLDEEESAKDFLRVKAVLNVVRDNRMYVLQAVHMLKNKSFTRPWPKGEKRENRIIFIGRGMQQRREELTAGFMACIVKPLRFSIGAFVQAKTGPNYEDGKIIKHWDEYNAYRIQLRSGGEVFAPVDDDKYVIKGK